MSNEGRKKGRKEGKKEEGKNFINNLQLVTLA